MRFAIRTTSLAILIFGGLATAHGQETALTREASAALRHFLTVDCEVGEEGTAFDRLLLYADQGEELVGTAAQRMPDRRSLLRRSTLEDVFLKITGRRLQE